MPNDKIGSLIGFALRSGKAILGLNRISEQTAHTRLIFVSEDLSDNALKKLKNISLRFGIPIVKTKLGLEKITGIIGCKALAITDSQMADAALGYLNDNYQLIVAEEI